MFKHAIGDDGLKVIKTFSYSETENANDWRVVMGKMEKHCIGEVNEIYERYCFNKRDKLPTETVDNFVAELKTLAKTCVTADLDPRSKSASGYGPPLADLDPPENKRSIE